MRFIKYHGLGNDFVIALGGMEGAPPLSPEQVRRLCERGPGIGADGVAFARPSSVADLRMELTNSDGSIPEMCGNGIRCLVKHAVDVLGLEANPLRVETGGGVKPCWWRRGARGVEEVRVSMGRPTFEREEVPVLGDGEALDVEVVAEERVFRATGVNTGNPHMVIFGDHDPDLARRWGPVLTCHPLWPAGANVEFTRVEAPDHLSVTVWERGCGLTRACGTGATAAVAAAVRHGWAPFGEPVRVSLPGGRLHIEIGEGFREAWMTGPVEEVYRAELTASL